MIDQLPEGLNRARKSINGSKILVFGLAYKRDIDDLRESPSLTIIELLREKGALVAYNDPSFPTVGHGRHYDLNMISTPLDNLAQYDTVVIVTDHSQSDYSAIVANAKCHQRNLSHKCCSRLSGMLRGRFGQRTRTPNPYGRSRDLRDLRGDWPTCDGWEC
ncbi:MAG: UDP binding domain-containing protein [Terracidiphilus sp.]